MPVCWLVGWSVCPYFIEAEKIHFQSPYRSTYFGSSLGKNTLGRREVRCCEGSISSWHPQNLGSTQNKRQPKPKNGRQSKPLIRCSTTNEDNLNLLFTVKMFHKHRQPFINSHVALSTAETEDNLNLEPPCLCHDLRQSEPLIHCQVGYQRNRRRSKS